MLVPHGCVELIDDVDGVGHSQPTAPCGQVNTTARLASHDLGTPMKWPKMSMHDETARRPDGMVAMHVSCKRIDHQSTQSDGMPCMMHDPRQPLETPNFRYAGRDFSNLNA